MRLLFLAFLAVLATAKYSVTATRLSALPILSSQTGQSIYKFNYNAAAFELGGEPHLLVRCQNNELNSTYDVTPSVLALVSAQFVPEVTASSVVFSPSSTLDNYGTEDPRVIYWSSQQQYVLTYTAAEQFSNGSVIARLAVATSPDAKNWTRQGTMFEYYSKSGALLFDRPNGGKNAMIFGDSSIVAGLQLAYQGANLSDWLIQPGIYLPIRYDKFDSFLVEAGPPPMQLSDGNLLFVYNSAQQGYPSVKPGFELQYNIGYVIINSTDLTILQRSEYPILTPALEWEIGFPPYLGLTPNVVFANGMIRGPRPDTFILYYGGADSVIGTALITVLL